MNVTPKMYFNELMCSRASRLKDPILFLIMGMFFLICSKVKTVLISDAFFSSFLDSVNCEPYKITF